MSAVSHVVGLRLPARGQQAPVSAGFRYDEREPFEVRAVLGAGLATEAEVARFLEATYWLVAPGAEPARTDIDAGIAAILAGGVS